MQDLEMGRRDFADFDFLVVNGGIAEVFGEALSEPDREPLKIQVHDGVRVFVVDDFIRIVGFDVGSDRNEVAGLAGREDSSRVHPAFHFPIARQKKFQGVFVFYREDDQGLAQVHAKFRESAVEDLAELFELVGDFSSLVFAGVADYLEMGRLNFDPGVFGVDAGGASKR